MHELRNQNVYFTFTTQPNTLKGWGMGALVSQAQEHVLIATIRLQESG